jgi:hypothetical protein
MKKFKKVIGLALGALAVGVIVLSLVAEREILITSTEQIQGTRQEVFNQLSRMKNFPNWSPYRYQDPQQKFSFSGDDGKVGGTFHWEGVKEKSRGKQTLAATNGKDQLTIKCDIMVPFESHPTFAYELKEKGGSIHVVQKFSVNMPFPSNIFAKLFGVKPYLTQTNKRGLSLLKAYIEGLKNGSIN